MRFVIIAVLLLAGCGTGERGRAPNGGEAAARQLEWTLQRQGGGATLALVGTSEVEMRLICPGQGELQINVPAFRPVGSEERMTFGQGGTVETFVADSSGDEELGGVTARGDVPSNLQALLSGKVAANYGAQNTGPHPPLPPQLVSQFVNACRTGRPAQQAQGASSMDKGSGQGNVSACLIQDGERITANRLHAVGTEPFWAANVKGRCVTYSTPENIDGTRIWTQFSGTAENGRWSGALDDQRFVMATEPQPGCSDGMSDKRYPISVTLTVRGEQRRGCAEYK